jgi:hypothetical protein
MGHGSRLLDSDIFAMKYAEVEKLKKRLKRRPRNFAEGESICRDAHAMLETFQAEVLQLIGIVDALLKHCDEPECSECAKAVCPFKDEMHFHHDGCPSCADVEGGEAVESSLIVLPE